VHAAASRAVDWAAAVDAVNVRMTNRNPEALFICKCPWRVRVTPVRHNTAAAVRRVRSNLVRERLEVV
jgi:hypothetical protein